ncbi:MAG: enoyl-CoA hydratase-related protein [Aigarchaeota archaeon]|nr:enoyl-CoA hydratase-related protein [Aigarchaeota archaeon]MDH5704055.1 enoyl-CoA hydratase-related protein [Aigarchaeota archaeon]
MEYKNIIYTREGSFLSPEENIAVIKLNRPDALNSFSPEMLTELENLLDEISKDDTIRSVVITGAGERAFSSGADLKLVSTALRTPGVIDEAAVRQYMEQGQRVFRKIEDLSKPVIAAINGWCLGGGLELAAACDIRIASENAKLGHTEVRLGLIPGWGGTQRTAKIIGVGRAQELILTGGQISATDAEKIGLVNKVVPPDELMSTANWTAGQIAANAPVAIRLAKKLVKKSTDLNIVEGNKLELDAILECIKTEDIREGVQALFEKRSPQFKGK